MKTSELSTSCANFLAAYNYGRIDALEGSPRTRFTGEPKGSEEEIAAWPQIRKAYLEGFDKQQRVTIRTAKTVF